MEKVEEKQKSWKERGKNKYKQSREEEGRKSKRVSESIWTELTQDLIPSQEILYQLKEQEVSEPIWTELTQNLMSFSRDPISTITVKLRAIALKETTWKE